MDDDDLKTHPKKCKLKSLISSYEFAPRLPVPHPLAATPSAPRHSIGGQNRLIDWIECETFVLQDAWGDPFLQRGKKKKYKKEKAKFTKSGGATSKWTQGSNVFMNPKVYLNRANGLDEMRNSPGNSKSAEGGNDDSDGLPPKKRMYGRENDDREKKRMDFHKDLKLQKKQIMKRVHAEIAKIQQGDDTENDNSVENASG
ncbi:hypothetical protein FF2_046028 [Malus domestica]